jgi:glutaminyl-peptide cyclotransferase
LIIGAILSYFFPLFLSSNNIAIQNIDITLQFEGENAYISIEDQLNLGYRIPGTEESINCNQYFISKFKQLNENITYILHNFTVHSTECQNVLFKLNENYTNIVILAAHYDTRARATKDSNNLNDPVPGANDGASGCAILVKLAKIFYEKINNLSCQLWFLFFDAEDQGLDLSYGMDGWDWCEGSKNFVEHIEDFYDSEVEKFDCMILLDMVGGNNLRFINEQYSTSSLLKEIFEVGRGLGFTTEFPKEPIKSSIIDDHRAFAKIGIPSADLIINFWNNPDWPYHHTTSDNITHISINSLNVTGKTIEQFIYNNYLDIQVNDYKGYFPWKEDINIYEIEVICIGIMIILIIGAFVSIIYIFKKE